MVSTFTNHTIVRTERMRICDICIQKKNNNKKTKKKKEKYSVPAPRATFDSAFFPFIVLKIFSHFHFVYISISRIYILVFKGFSLERVVRYSQIDSVGVSGDSNGSIGESESVLCGWLIERGIFIIISAFLPGVI